MIRPHSCRNIAISLIWSFDRYGPVSVTDLHYVWRMDELLIKTAFGPNLPLLAAIKQKHDPRNFSCVNQNIAPGNPISKVSGYNFRKVARCMERNRDEFVTSS